jgi:pimeloyl-ACP methyl ester carboxylesterase
VSSPWRHLALPPPCGASAVVVGAALLLLLAAPSAIAETSGPRRFDRVGVPGDSAVRVRPGASDDARVLVYLPGKCGNPEAPFEAFPAAAAAAGTLVVVEGSIRCPGSRRRRWESDLAAIDRRVRRAVQAVATARGGSEKGKPLDQETATILGYSEGALRAEGLARRFPERYPAAVIMASPRKPAALSFERSRRVAFVVGERDRRDLMVEGAGDAQKVNKNVRLFLLPGATHGTYGPAGERVMGEVLGFVGERARKGD